MNQALSAALLVVGALLLFFGISASESLGSTFSEMVSGTPTERSIWLIGLGVAGIIAGIVGLFQSSNT